MDIETIYRLYFRDVCLFLQGLTRSEALAEELTQETFFRALDGLKDYDGKQDVRAWLFTVARNAYYDHCRRAKHAAPLEDAETKAADSPDITQLLVDKDAAFTVHQCLHALEEPYKEVFSLRVFGELPFERIGAIFGHNAAWARVTPITAPRPASRPCWNSGNDCPPREPSQSRLTACQLPRKGELFCVAARFACPGVTPSVKKVAPKRPLAFRSHKL